MNKKSLLLLVFLMALLNGTLTVSAQNPASPSAYLFTYFTGNSGAEESIRFAISIDGYNYHALNSNMPVLKSSEISSSGGVRDPHILRGEDGKTFYMVATDMVSAKGWDSNRAMVLLKSTDLINWTSSIVNIQDKFPGNEDLLRVWAPQTIYDKSAGKYMIYWSMKHGNDPDKIYYAYANKDFTDLETSPKQLFFSPDNGAAIDGDIIYHNGKYHLFFKSEGSGAGIGIAVSDKLAGGYAFDGKYVQQTTDPVEGAGVFRLNNDQGYILMYDVYTKGKYQFTETKDFKNFKVVDNAVSMDFHPRHGTVLPITTEEAERLMKKWYQPVSVLAHPLSKSIKKNNITLDSAKKELFYPVVKGTNLKAFNPEFPKLPGLKISPSAPYNLSAGKVTIQVAISGQPSETFTLSAAVNGNPVLNGYYADPDILYSNNTKKYYIYPTSDGFKNWSGNYFKAFSSENLVDWKDEGVILDLVKDVSWAKRNAWAPTMAEKNINGTYKYFYYFTAAQKIGVATSDMPTGPFKDNGKALVSSHPKGVNGGQEIDPFVFTDPKSAKSYLYWGNGYMAVAELNADMISLDTNSVRVITPDASFREGTAVFYRKGKYYFLWSEDDTRSENYRVRYGYADSPAGKIIIPEKNLILSKDPSKGIYGTGHNSVIQVPGKDEWYMVYHRFTRPMGIKMGDAAGFNREVCLDRMYFDADGHIIPVIPTLEGKLK